MTSFQILSDIHIEYQNDEIPDPLSIITPSAEILILAGDIGSLYKYSQLKGFLKKLCSHFEIVLYVPGNHEFYNVPNYETLSMTELTSRLKNLEKEIENLHILNRTSFIINDICIIGCTLWSKINIEIPKFIVRINDITYQKYNAMFQKDLKYLEKMIKYCEEKNYKIVVVTHHCPTFKVLYESKKRTKFSSLYVSNLEYLFKNNIVGWICGHIHKNFDFKLNNTRVVGNQKGKPKDEINDFSKNFVIKF